MDVASKLGLFSRRIERSSFVPGSWSASSVFFPSHRYPLSHEGSCYLSTRSAYCRSLSFCPCTLRERKIWLVKGLMKTSILIFSILISSWITAKGEGEKLVLTDHPIACDENSYRFASKLPTKPLVLDESRANLSEEALGWAHRSMKKRGDTW